MYWAFVLWKLAVHRICYRTPDLVDSSDFVVEVAYLYLLL